MSTVVSKFTGNADSFAESVQMSTDLLKIVGVGDSLQHVERVLSGCCQCGYTLEIHHLPRGPQCAWHAGGILPVDGVDWH